LGFAEKKLMAPRLHAGLLLLPILGSLTFTWNAQAGSSKNSNLTVEVDGLKNRNGQVCLRLFSSSKGFPEGDESIVRRECVKVTSVPLRVTFRDLKRGTYAVAVLHDANGDNKANRNFIGLPKEGFGFSRNPVVRMSPPKFDDVSFKVSGANTSIQIQLQYVL
jgi:uncharacterized protein (DUF2141 family)